MGSKIQEVVEQYRRILQIKVEDEFEPQNEMDDESLTIQFSSNRKISISKYFIFFIIITLIV